MNSSPINVIAVISAFISTICAEDDILQSHLILSGRTGSGKTKTVKKISDILKQKGIPFSGFYTIDHMIGNSRCGFDMIDLNSNRSAPIARIAYMSETKGPRVGRYVVNLEAFEDFVKSIFSDFEKLPSILLLDEVGKMELESVLFQGILTDLFKMGSQYIIVVSVPERRHDLKVLVNICKMPTSRIIAVNSENRDLLPEMLAKEIIQMHKMITASESSTPMSPTT